MIAPKTESPNCPAPPRTCSVLGVPLAVTDYAGAVELTHAWAHEAAASGAVYAVEAAASHSVTLARHDPRFGASLAQFDLIVPDGMPVVWAMNWQGAGLRDRVYGPTLMLRTLEKPGVSHFLMGGTEDLLVELTAKLREKFPHLVIAGTYAPPFGTWPPGENERIFRQIADSGAECIWVGLGCPKQEHWVAQNKPKLPPGVYFTVGAAFAFHAGRVRQAPLWIQRRGLEWLFRLLSEPRRLWKRYVIYNSLFLWYLLLAPKASKPVPPSSL